MKFTQLAGLFLAAGSLILLGQVTTRVSATAKCCHSSGTPVCPTISWIQHLFNIFHAN